MKQAIISNRNGKVAIASPYDRDFVEALKSAISDRQWDRDNKVWLVAENEADEAVEVAKRFYEVVDGRNQSADEVEEAQIGAEIAQIKANQEWLLENESYIEEAIDALDGAIRCYSPRSGSSIKGRMCRDRALLGHSLSNAKLPIEQLTELHVRGLSAARRLLEEYSIAQLTSRN